MVRKNLRSSASSGCDFSSSLNVELARKVDPVVLNQPVSRNCLRLGKAERRKRVRSKCEPCHKFKFVNILKICAAKQLAHRSVKIFQRAAVSDVVRKRDQRQADYARQAELKEDRADDEYIVYRKTQSLEWPTSIRAEHPRHSMTDSRGVGRSGERLGDASKVQGSGGGGWPRCLLIHI